MPFRQSEMEQLGSPAEGDQGEESIDSSVARNRIDILAVIYLLCRLFFLPFGWGGEEVKEKKVKVSISLKSAGKCRYSAVHSYLTALPAHRVHALGHRRSFTMGKEKKSKKEKKEKKEKEPAYVPAPPRSN